MRQTPSRSMSRLSPPRLRALAPPRLRALAPPRLRALGLALAASTGLTTAALAQQSVKIAFIDPLSGGAASTGEAGLKTFQYMAEQANGQQKEFKLEVTGYDNKLNPQESLVQLQKAIDSGARYVIQGNGSAVAAAITDFVVKFNERNPGKEIVYLNYAAVDPVLTNEKCNYWHFRFDASADIKMEALTNYIKAQQAVKKVYLMNQDYSFGQSVRKEAREKLTAKRPDVQIVGDEVTPLQRVTDFSPYIAKIKAAGSDAIVTGNWAQDLTLLVKAAGDAGLQATFYTYYAGGSGAPTAVKQANLPNRVLQVSEGIANSELASSRDFEKAYRAKVGAEVTYPRGVNLINMLVKAMQAAKSSDPKKVAAALEGMTFTPLGGGEAFMRKDDHQFFQPMYISALGPTDSSLPFDSENTGWGWKQVGVVTAKDSLVPTTCKMDRPS